MSSEEKFVFESLQDCESIRAFLEALTEGVGSKHLVLSSGGERIELYPQGLLQVEVKARRKGGSSKVSLKLEWKDAPRVETSDRTLSVSSN